MDIEHSYTIELDKGLDKDAHDSSVYLAKSNLDSSILRPRTVVIAGREAGLLTLLLSGRKLKEFAGGELIGLFVQE